MDPTSFLALHAPFNELSTEGLDQLAAELEVSYIADGERILERGRPNKYLWVVRQGVVRLELDGQRVDELGEGEVFGLSSLGEGGSPRFDALAERDCLLYRLSASTVRPLMGRERGFAAFFVDGLGQRLRALTDSATVRFGTSDLATPVGELVTRAPVALGLGMTVGRAAEQMREEGVSSVLVIPEGGAEGTVGTVGTERSRPVGILTDRDLRSRVLAEGHGPDWPVAEVMSKPVISVDAGMAVSEVMLLMLRRRIHHLPVERDGALIGLVTHTDLLNRQQRSPVALLRRIQRADDPRQLDDYADGVADMVEGLERGGLAATEIGRLVAALGDALASRLLDRAEADLGPPPVPYAWIVFGSEGRHEQSLLTDQDNALIYDDPGPGDDPAAIATYFARLAERMVGDLVAVGFPPCAGGFMATHWCKPLGEWVELFRSWCEEPEPEALLQAANFFDFRRVHGELGLDTLDQAVAKGSRSQLFLAHLTRAALDMRPPLGILRRIKEDPKGVDLKAGAIVPIVSLARLLALEAGVRRGSTLERLAAARQGKTLSGEGEELLAESFRFVFGLRLRHQLEQRRFGQSVDNRVRLEDLGASERRHLKEAFLAVRRMQTAIAERLGVDRLG